MQSKTQPTLPTKELSISNSKFFWKSWTLRPPGQRGEGLSDVLSAHISEASVLYGTGVH